MRKNLSRDTAASAMRSALRALSGHDPVQALPLIRKAVDSCPVDNHAELERRMYWLAITLLRVGRNPLAIKALANARRVLPRGKACRLYKHLTNGYGMPKSSCVEHDDYKAFFSIHVRRYLGSVPGKKFSSRIEMDTVLELIANAWMRFKATTPMDGCDCEEKLGLFQKIRIDFPRLRLSGNSSCSIFSFSAHSISTEFSIHTRVYMPWEHESV